MDEIDEIDNIDIGGIRARDPQVIGAGDRGNAYQVTGRGRPGAGPQPKRLRSTSTKHHQNVFKTYQKKQKDRDPNAWRTPGLSDPMT